MPIFFFVSGFLISKPYEQNSRAADYALNRALRIYPALLVCLFVSLLLVWITGYFRTHEVSPGQLIPWLLAQGTIAQFYNPGFLRDYGVGVLNGSVWTICVELQFYVLVPVLYALLRPALRGVRAVNGTLLMLILVFLVANRLFHAGAGQYGEAIWYKLLSVSFAPWFYMFLIGVWCQRNAAIWQGAVTWRFAFPLAFIAYVALAYGGNEWLGLSLGNQIGPLLFCGLAVLTLTAVFNAPTLSDRLLKRNDISYGVYIYHMPVANFMLVMGLGGEQVDLWIGLGGALLLAALSWWLVEKPALSFKRRALYQHQAPARPA